MAAGLDAFEWLELRTRAGLAPGVSPGTMVSVLKLRASRMKQAIAELGSEVLGLRALRWRSLDRIQPAVTAMEDAVVNTCWLTEVGCKGKFRRHCLVVPVVNR